MTLPDSLSIRVRGLGKSYQINHLQNQEVSDRPALESGSGSIWPWKRLPRQRLNQETFWALRDLSFDVKSGQVLGIIGRNGAGKSTFLKILSRIIEPTQGLAEIRGRVGSLLEVGTGFHPELTGRENIYLNGTLLGMRRKQISAIFDEIVEFAEVARFIDTPVKRYSSGMYVRLAFAVAAHLQPDVLIIDEVLSVGDAVFQEKCLGRMQSLGSTGRTVIFVSHNMEAVAALCDRAIVLHEGKIFFDGSPQDAADAYYGLCSPAQNSQVDYRERGGSCPDVINRVTSHYHAGNSEAVPNGPALLISISGALTEHSSGYCNNLKLAIGINQEDGGRLATYIAGEDDEPIAFDQDAFDYVFRIQDPPFLPGTYSVDVSLISRGETIDSLQRCSSFRIAQSTASSYQAPDPGWGAVRLTCSGYNTSIEQPGIKE